MDTPQDIPPVLSTGPYKFTNPKAGSAASGSKT